MAARQSSRLESHGPVQLYVGSDEAPRTMRIGRQTYYRYMDRLFLPSPIWELAPSETAVVAELRFRLGAELIDSAFTQRILGELLDRALITPGTTLLDFGCGDGNVAAHVTAVPRHRPKEVVGVDLCDSVASVAEEKLAALDLGTAIPVGVSGLDLQTSYFDGAIANFVMQFPVYERQMEDLCRSLKPGARFVYNSHYASSAARHHDDTKQLLSRIGFDIAEDIAVVSRGSEPVSEVIVVCTRRSG